MVGCLVTLGSPHALHHAPLGAAHEGVRLAAFLDEHVPGAWHAPRTGYLTVAADTVSVPPADAPPRRGPVARLRHAFFRRVTGPILGPGSDGIVSVSIAHLEGAHQLTLHEALHGVTGSPWYGDGAVIDSWWPAAVSVWRAALEARSEP
jgi:hypothetical protein